MTEIGFASQKDLTDKIVKGVTLVWFHAPWCSPCLLQNPIMEEIEEAYAGRVPLLKVNVDENQKTALNLGIQSIPTSIIFKEAIEISRFIGLQTAETLSRAIVRCFG